METAESVDLTFLSDPTETPPRFGNEDKPKLAARLVLVNKSEVGKVWPLFETAIINSRPPDLKVHQYTLTNMLAALMHGDIQGWVAYAPRTDGKHILFGVILTTVTRQACSGELLLSILSLYGFGNNPTRIWREGMQTLKQYAKYRGCSRIFAFTSQRNVLRIAEMLECNSDTVVLEWEVE